MKPLRDRILFASWRDVCIIKHFYETNIENFVRTPQYTTLMRLLYPLGYTLKVVPLKKK